MGTTFADKFEQALTEKKAEDPTYGVRTIARHLSDGDRSRIETIRRRLNKYRPKPGGGAAEVAPTEPTRHEIEDAMGLDRDTLAPERDQVAAFAGSLLNIGALDEFLLGRARAAHDQAALESNTPTASLAGSAAGASTEGA